MAGGGERRGPKLSEASEIAEATRKRRVAEAMRENLLKRKRQQRAVAAAKSAEGSAGDGGDPV